MRHGILQIGAWFKQGAPSLIMSRIYLAQRERRKAHLLFLGGMTSGLAEPLRSYRQLDS